MQAVTVSFNWRFNLNCGPKSLINGAKMKVLLGFIGPTREEIYLITPYLRFVFFIKSPNDVKSVAVSHILASIYLHIFIHWLDCIYNYYFEIISFVYKNSTCATESRLFFWLLNVLLRAKL